METQDLKDQLVMMVNLEKMDPMVNQEQLDQRE